ncbi:LLM class flavin-dependent oxidoreductase [Nocardioides sp. LML1-1-1.1]|uniref:LLM class flavin-dependent oxidoreductase n=1 Tax=Nocardioides sp. LML1-1-1.1 TaxID=3135248 RepID=UPI0034171BB5
MKIGLGLPGNIAGSTGNDIVEWARAGEQRGFDALAATDRFAYPSHGCFTQLAAAAAVTTRPELMSNIILGPLYPTGVLQKLAADLASLSGGRFVAGIGVGGRPDDFVETGAAMEGRGARLDATLQEFADVTTGGTSTRGGTAITGQSHPIPVVLGGTVAATWRRVVAYADGWTAGSYRDYDAAGRIAEDLRRRWTEAGRAGTPLLIACCNVALRERERGRDHVGSYYAAHPGFVDRVVDDLVTTAREARDTVRRFGDLGFDSVNFHAAVPDLDQVERLADAVLG